MDYPKAVDPAHILTMTDLDLSIALGSTLVTYNDSRELVSGLAERWVVSSETIVFFLRPDLKWSDGSHATAKQYEASLKRAQKLYGTDLRALFDSIESFSAVDDQALAFRLRPGTTPQSLIMKLTEPMYALIATTSNGSLDLTKSTGAYSLEKIDDQLLRLKANPNWFARTGHEPEAVEIKRPVSGGRAIEEFASDTWANLISGNSIQRQSTLDEFKQKKFGIWSRKLDKLFALYPTRAFIERGGDKFIRKLKGETATNALMSGLAGYTPAEQFFPRGYPIWSPEKPKANPSEFTPHGPIKILIPSTYSYLPVVERLPKILESQTGAKVVIEAIPLQDINDRMKKKDYDILATGLAVADPNFEGAVSFFIEREPPFISSGSGSLNFAERVKKARSLPTLEDRASAMRAVFADAQAAGYFLPLFHSSSFAVVKPEADLSQVPDTLETIIFSKVRMK